jgi:hypothetical protein
MSTQLLTRPHILGSRRLPFETRYLTTAVQHDRLERQQDKRYGLP